MQVTVENPGGLQRKLTVEVPGDEVQKKIDARLREIGKTAKLSGFRPGRIPMKVLQQRYGPSVRNEIVDFVGDDVMEGIKAGIFDDFPIWEHKIYREKPVFCQADNTLVMFRKWVRQFYL